MLRAKLSTGMLNANISGFVKLIDAQVELPALNTLYEWADIF